jgi:hypothetical protein
MNLAITCAVCDKRASVMVESRPLCSTHAVKSLDDTTPASDEDAPKDDDSSKDDSSKVDSSEDDGTEGDDGNDVEE